MIRPARHPGVQAPITPAARRPEAQAIPAARRPERPVLMILQAVQAQTATAIAAPAVQVPIVLQIQQLVLLIKIIPGPLSDREFLNHLSLHIKKLRPLEPELFNFF